MLEHSVAESGSLDIQVCKVEVNNIQASRAASNLEKWAKGHWDLLKSKELGG